MQAPEQIFNLIIQLQITGNQKIKIINKKEDLKNKPRIFRVYFFIEE